MEGEKQWQMAMDLKRGKEDRMGFRYTLGSKRWDDNKVDEVSQCWDTEAHNKDPATQQPSNRNALLW